MFTDPTFWVAVAFVCFIALVFKPLSKFAAGALDSRAEKIKEELDEAERLRNEAQDLLAQYQRKQSDAAKEAEEIIQHARDEAERLDHEGRARLSVALERREKLAMDRIQLAEQQAVDKVRNEAIAVAISAAESVLAQNLDKSKADALIDDSIAGLSDKLH